MGIEVQPAAPAFAVLLALSACFVDPGTVTGASGMTGTGSTTAVEVTSTAVTTSGGPAFTSSASSSGASDPVGTDATTGAACVAAGGDCTGPGASCCGGCLACVNGTCAADPSACGPCQACDGQGGCAPEREGATCSPAVDPCSGRAWGAVNGECFAFAAAQGSCGPQGDCVPQQCEAQGALVFSCPQCVLDKHACQAGADLGGFTVAEFCHLNEETADCGVECVNNGLGAQVKHKSCNSKGKCTALGTTDCGLYACNGAQCYTSCMSAAECVLSKCIAGKCG